MSPFSDSVSELSADIGDLLQMAAMNDFMQTHFLNDKSNSPDRNDVQGSLVDTSDKAFDDNNTETEIVCINNEDDVESSVTVGKENDILGDVGNSNTGIDRYTANDCFRKKF